MAAHRTGSPSRHRDGDVFSACTRSRPCLGEPTDVRHRVVVVLQPGAQGHAVRPTKAAADPRSQPSTSSTHGRQNRPLSSPAPTGSPGSAASPFTHTLHDGSTLAKTVTKRGDGGCQHVAHCRAGELCPTRASGLASRREHAQRCHWRQRTGRSTPWRSSPRSPRSEIPSRKP